MDVSRGALHHEPRPFGSAADLLTQPEVPAGVGDATTGGHVLAQGQAPGAGQEAGQPGQGLISLNSATAADLTVLPGVGDATAAAIVAHRESAGPFTAVEQLMDVKGIGPAKFEAMKDLVTL